MASEMKDIYCLKLSKSLLIINIMHYLTASYNKYSKLSKQIFVTKVTCFCDKIQGYE